MSRRSTRRRGADSPEDLPHVQKLWEHRFPNDAPTAINMILKFGTYSTLLEDEDFLWLADWFIEEARRIREDHAEALA